MQHSSKELIKNYFFLDNEAFLGKKEERKERRKEGRNKEERDKLGDTYYFSNGLKEVKK